MKVFKKLQFIFVASVSMVMVTHVHAEHSVSFSMRTKGRQALQVYGCIQLQ